MSADDFNPQVYNFVLPNEYAESFNSWGLNSYEVTCPSPTILLEHTLAVIWHIYANNKREITNLNIADIVWALRFLESIDTKDAINTTCLDLIIKQLRQLLMLRYAMEDEKSFANATQTFLDSSFSNVTSSSFSMDEYLSCPEVQEDLGKAVSIASLAPTGQCTKAEITQQLKDIMKTSPGIKVEDLVKMLEQP